MTETPIVGIKEFTEVTKILGTELPELKSNILKLLGENPQLAYGMEELAKMFNQDRVLIQKAVSQLDDEGKVRLRVGQKKVYVHIIGVNKT